jgi:S-DNA-T family DNA segregation ATPase FtsK/SpoIIIE
MLFQAPDSPAPVRLQGTYVSDVEINRITDFWRAQTVSGAAPERPDVAIFTSQPHVPLTQDPLWKEMEKDPDEDPIEKEALALFRKEGRASVSMLQRKLRIGYTRAARLVEKLEQKGMISAPEPQTGTREILDWGNYPPLNED